MAQRRCKPKLLHDMTSSYESCDSDTKHMACFDKLYSCVVFVRAAAAIL